MMWSALFVFPILLLVVMILFIFYRVKKPQSQKKAEEKNRISHRARALERMREVLNKRAGR